MALDQRLRLNSILGSFQVKRLIGKGGMGEVYEAYEPILERKVALKIISAEAANDEYVVKSFRNEGKALAQINHPYVVSIFSFGEDQGVEYIAMEYVEGQNLKEKIKAKEFDLRQSIFIFKQVLSGIKALHANRIIHRDLKPPNIILQANGKPKIVDFGIAKRVREGSITSTGINEPQNVMGSIYYISPELLNGSPATIQADIWSLGVIFYEMLTFIRPFRGKSQDAIMDNIFNKPLTFSPYVKSILPHPVQAIIKKMCAKDPELRYLSIEEIEGDLIRWEQSDPNFNIKLDNDPDQYENLEKTSVKEVKTKTNFRTGSQSSIVRTGSVTNLSAQDRLKTRRRETSIRHKRTKKRQTKSTSGLLYNALAIGSLLVGALFLAQAYENKVATWIAKIRGQEIEFPSESSPQLESDLPTQNPAYVDETDSKKNPKYVGLPGDGNKIVADENQPPTSENPTRNTSSTPYLSDRPSLLAPEPGVEFKSQQINPYHTIAFEWEKTDKAMNYTLQISPSPEFESDKIFYQIDTNKTKEIIQFELPLSNFYWRVRANNQFSVGPWSDSRTFKVIP